MDYETSITPELESLLSKLTEEIASDCGQVEVLQKRIKKNESLLQAIKSRLGVANAISGYGAKIEVVRQAVQHLNKTVFTQEDVEIEIKRLNPTLTIDKKRVRAGLWTLANRLNFIKQAEKGSNRERALYEKTPASLSNGSVGGAPNPNRGIATNAGILTPATLEAFVGERNRRMNELTAHFGTDEKTIRKFFEPASKVYEATRGWIKIHEWRKI
jgi:hypothetical protein